MSKLVIGKAKSIDDAKYVFLGIPTDLGAKSQRKGRIKAPDKIRQLSEDWFIPLRGKLNENIIYDVGNLKLDSKDIFKNIESIDIIMKI